MCCAERARPEYRRPAGGRHLPSARPGAIQVRGRTSRFHPLYHATSTARSRRYVSLTVGLWLTVKPIAYMKIKSAGVGIAAMGTEIQNYIMFISSAVCLTALPFLL